MNDLTDRKYSPGETAFEAVLLEAMTSYDGHVTNGSWFKTLAAIKTSAHPPRPSDTESIPHH